MTPFHLKIHKLLHWEYWPMEVIYLPVFPIWLYFAFKARSFFFFNAANPSIKNGGMAMESKKEIYDIIPSQYIPKTVLINKGMAYSKIICEIKIAGIQFPLIAKPDIGMKAFGVDKLDSEEELKNYINKFQEDFLIQELITYQNELGVFYVRYPGESKGKITGIVEKNFLSVTGNGVDSILQRAVEYSRWLVFAPTVQSQTQVLLPIGLINVLYR